MNKDMIKNYASNIERKDIVDFANKEGVNINEAELNTIYNMIKNDQEQILTGDFYQYIKRYKNSFNEGLYSKIIEKYEKYKNFIN